MTMLLPGSVPGAGGAEQMLTTVDDSFGALHGEVAPKLAPSPV
jgi:hypothetical protein